MMKFIPQKAHRHKETAICWSIVCSKNAHERRRVKEGDTIEIFHHEVGVMKPYTLSRNQGAKYYAIYFQPETGKHLDANLSASKILNRVIRMQNS